MLTPLICRTSAPTWTVTTTVHAPAGRGHVLQKTGTRARRSTCARRATEAAATPAPPPMDRSASLPSLGLLVVSVFFLHQKDPFLLVLFYLHINDLFDACDQVYCSCPTGEQLGDDWKTCRAPPQCPEACILLVSSSKSCSSCPSPGEGRIRV